LEPSGKVEYRVDKAGNIHTSVGKKSFETNQLVENAATIISAVIKAKPSASKGVYLKKISVSTTMGPGVRVDPLDVSSKAA
jgi:large subunit ribosomal protein L1